MNDDASLVNIPVWSENDYLYGSAPYAWVASHEDPFERNQLLSVVEKDAKRHGIRNFKNLYKAYEDSLKASGAKKADCVTDFPNQPLGGLDSGEYICDAGGVTLNDRFGGTITVCSHPILPIERLKDVETGEYKIRIAFSRGGAWESHIVDMETIRTARQITTLANYGISVNSETAKYLVQYMSYIEDHNYKEIPETKTISRLGWMADEDGKLTLFSPFIDGVTYDSGGQYEQEFKSIREFGSYDEWLKLAKEVRSTGSMAARVVLAASFASVIVSKVGALPFIVHIWGVDSGTGKTVALMLAASVWANPEQGFYVKTTKATDFALEKLSYFVHNMPLCLDELQLIQDKKQFDNMIYSLTEGMGKPRGTRSGKLQQSLRWSNVSVLSGEMPIISTNSKAGAVNRVIEIETTKGNMIFKNGPTVANTLKANYGFAGRKFVEHFSTDEDADDLMKTEYARFCAQLNGQATDKQTLSAAVILTADALADRWIFHDGNSLTVDDILPYLVSQDAADVNLRAYEELLDFVSQFEDKFVPVDGAYKGECWGRYEFSKQSPSTPERICIIKSVFDEFMQQRGYNSKAFTSWAKTNGDLIRTTSNGRTDPMVRIPERVGTPPRCICLKIAYDFKEGAADDIPF